MKSRLLVVPFLVVVALGCPSAPAECEIDCPEGKRCDPDTGRCLSIDPNQKDDAGSDGGEADAGHDAGHDAGTQQSGDGGSDGGADGGSWIVVMAGDTCDMAGEIPQLPATFSGNTIGYDDDYDHCSTSAGSDLVYRFTLPSRSSVTISVSPTIASRQFRPLVYLRNSTSCASSGSTGSAGCIGSIAQGTPVKLVAPDLPAGDYFLVIDGMQDSAGEFVAHLESGPVQTAPTNESCASAERLSFVNGVAIVSSTTQGTTSDSSNAGCFSSSSLGPDVVYTFTTPALGAGESALNLKTVLVSDNADLYTPQLNLRRDCSNGTDAGQLLCVGTSSNPLEVRGLLTQLAPSTDYFLIVESASTTRTAGPFTLEVGLAAFPVANDSCAGAITVTANTTIVGSTLGASNQYDQSGNTWYSGGSCSPGAYTYGGPDVVYAFTAQTTGMATVTVTPQRTYDVAVAVLSACSMGSCVSLSDTIGSSGTEVLTFGAVQGESYFIVIDSFVAPGATNASRAGGFTLGVSL